MKWPPTARLHAEISVGFDNTDTLDEALGGSDFRKLPVPYEAAFIAGEPFVEYRRRGGARRSPLPDFYIGAHAAIANLALLTRDARRYRSYFPGVKLISPV